MTQLKEVIDLTETSAERSKLETSSSRKHDRNEEESQVEGPKKCAKLNRNSEPPKRKDTSTTPRRKQKKPGKTINLHKASRASAHSELKAKVKILDHDLRDAEQVINATKQALKNTKQELRQNTSELKRVRKLCDEKSEDVRTQQRTNETDHEKLRSLNSLVEDPVNGIGALQESCRSKDEELKVKDEKIIFLQQERDDAKKERDKAAHEAEAALTINDSNGSRNEKLAERERTAKNTLKKERKEHKNTILGFQAEISKLQERGKELEKNLKTQESRLSGMIAGLQQQLQDARPQSQRFNFKVPDDKVHHDFAALESKIRQFVYKHTRPVLNATYQELQCVWSGWSPALRHFLASPVLCNLVFQAYVWERLLVSVFTPWSKVWAGELGQSLEKVLSMAGAESEQAGFESETYTHYQYLRSSSSSFICRLSGEDFRPEYFDLAVNDLVSTLEKLCGVTEFADFMKADAIGIFKDARDFEIQLRKLKAVYTFHMCKLVPGGKTFKFGVFFDDEGMIDHSPSTSDKKYGRVPIVDFIMSPGLHKRGNNDGDMYKDDAWLVKMGVVCDAARFFLKSDHSDAARPVSVQTPKALQSSGVKQEGEGQDVVLQYHTDTPASEVRLGTPISDPTHIKVEETYSQQDPDLLSTAVLSSGFEAPGSHDAAQVQSSMVTKVITRSQASVKTGNNVRDGQSSIESTDSHSLPM